MSRTIEDIRRDLTWTREQLARRLQRIRDDATHRRQPLSADAPDRAQETGNDAVLEQLGHGTAALIDQYQHAIERIDHGRYGLCEVCGFAIEPARLEAVPQATDCADCARGRAALH